MATLLSICQSAAVLIGGPQKPTSIINNSNDFAQTLLELANLEGEELARRCEWEALTEEATITTVASQENYALPSDFLFPINTTEWDRTNDRQMIGPVTKPFWQALKSENIPVSYLRYFRTRGGDVLIYPTPTVNGDTLYYEYISKEWAKSSGGAAQESFQADTDTPVLDGHLIKLGIIWRWLAQKKLPYQEEFNTYQMAVGRAIARDGGKQRLRLDGGGTTGRLFLENVPDTGFGL